MGRSSIIKSTQLVGSSGAQAEVTENGKLKVDAGEVTEVGSTVVIGGVTFAVSGGDTLRNTAANKPAAADAHAVIPFCYYFAVDTIEVAVTDGIEWVVL